MRRWRDRAREISSWADAEVGRRCGLELFAQVVLVRGEPTGGVKALDEWLWTDSLGWGARRRLTPPGQSSAE
jgi:hypothetical protein